MAAVGRRDRRWRWRAGAVALVAIWVGVSAIQLVGRFSATRGPARVASSRTAHAHGPRARGAALTSADVFNVLSYGANPDGIADNTLAFSDAIAAAQAAGGGTVYVPAGTYAFTQVLNNIAPSSIKVSGTVPVTIEGAGTTSCTTPKCNQSWLVEHVAGQSLLTITAAGSQVVGLTLDARSYQGGPDVTINADNTVVNDVAVLGAHKVGRIGGTFQAAYALRYPGPRGASATANVFNSGNTVENSYIEDGINNDGISFSYQQNGTFRNIVYFGSRLALYRDNGVTVTNFSYTPNPESGSGQNAYYITSPSENISITGFTTSGAGGVIGGPGDTFTSSNISVTDETMTGPDNEGFHIGVGNINGLTVSDSRLQGFVFNPTSSMSNVLVQNSTVPSVELEGYGGSDHYSSLSADFQGDTFPANPDKAPTFEEVHAVGNGTITIDGKQWLNQAYPFFRGHDGGSTSFVVTNLAPLYTAAPAIYGKQTVGQRLTASKGTWLAGQSPAPTSFTFQWNRGGQPIPGATAQFYTPVAADSGHKLTVTVTATNPTGSTQVTSPKPKNPVS